MIDPRRRAAAERLRRAAVPAHSDDFPQRILYAPGDPRHAYNPLADLELFGAVVTLFYSTGMPRRRARAVFIAFDMAQVDAALTIHDRDIDPTS